VTAALRAALGSLLTPDQVRASAAELESWSTDASPYRLVPRVLVVPRTPGEVAAVLRLARERGHGVVLRAGGTSTGGQALGGDILLDVRRAWSGVEVLDGGERVRLLPGTVLAHAERVLARHGRTLGVCPPGFSPLGFSSLGPAMLSARAATIGGALAQGAGGLAVESLTLLLASGTVVDTAAPDADARLRAAEPELWSGLRRLAAEVAAEPGLAAEIAAHRGFGGYRLEALADPARPPVELLAGLVPGSEGTLGFIAEAVLRTHPARAGAGAGGGGGAVLGFTDVGAAAEAGRALSAARPIGLAVELLDAAALRPAAESAGVPLEFGPELRAALLVEYAEPADGPRASGGPRAAGARAQEVGAAALRRLREAAAAAAVGGGERRGWLPLEVRVPGRRFAAACAALSREHPGISATPGRNGAGGTDGGIADLGTVRLLLPPGRAGLDGLLRHAIELGGAVGAAWGATGRLGASLLARSRTGRERELMRRIKELADPAGVLGRGVLLPSASAAQPAPKPAVAVGRGLDGCSECGLCEAVCPSRDLTTTPRRRIVLLRAVAALPAGSPRRAALEAENAYDVVDTCAVDGVCGPACPLGIDVGAAVRGLREERHSALVRRAATMTARHSTAAEHAVRAALRAAEAVRGRAGDKPLLRTGQSARRVLPDESLPEWLPELPHADRREGARPDPTPEPAEPPEPPKPAERVEPAVAYFPACTTRLFGGELPGAVAALGARAGRPVRCPAPDEAEGLCCGAVWADKGFPEAARASLDRLVRATRAWTDEGRLPLLVDSSRCALRISRAQTGLTVLDQASWGRSLLPRLTVTERLATAVLHPTCTTELLGADGPLAELGAALVEEAVVPDAAGCCGFAGDRGALHKELTASATEAEAREVRLRPFEAHLSAERMCEVAMEHATGRRYESVLTALERATRPAAAEDPTRPGAAETPNAPSETAD